MCGVKETPTITSSESGNRIRCANSYYGNLNVTSIYACPDIKISHTQSYFNCDQTTIGISNTVQCYVYTVAIYNNKPYGNFQQSKLLFANINFNQNIQKHQVFADFFFFFFFYGFVCLTCNRLGTHGFVLCEVFVCVCVCVCMCVFVLFWKRHAKIWKKTKYKM